jgi:hypothetical protein
MEPDELKIECPSCNRFFSPEELGEWGSSDPFKGQRICDSCAWYRTLSDGMS